MKRFALLLLLAGCCTPERVIPSDVEHAEARCAGNGGLENFKLHTTYFERGIRSAHIETKCKNGAFFSDSIETRE